MLSPTQAIRLGASRAASQADQVDANTQMAEKNERKLFLFMILRD
jgi:hypothetical protein